MSATFKDWTDLIHAVAWPLVALIALIMFRRSITKVLSRIPFERTTSLKAGGFGELKIAKIDAIAKETVISAIDAPTPTRSELSEKKRER